MQVKKDRSSEVKQDFYYFSVLFHRVFVGVVCRVSPATPSLPFSERDLAIAAAQALALKYEARIPPILYHLLLAAIWD